MQDRERSLWIGRSTIADYELASTAWSKAAAEKSVSPLLIKISREGEHSLSHGEKGAGRYRPYLDLEVTSVLAADVSAVSGVIPHLSEVAGRFVSFWTPEVLPLAVAIGAAVGGLVRILAPHTVGALFADFVRDKLRPVLARVFRRGTAQVEAELAVRAFTDNDLRKALAFKDSKIKVLATETRRLTDQKLEIATLKSRVDFWKGEHDRMADMLAEAEVRNEMFASEVVQLAERMQVNRERPYS